MNRGGPVELVGERFQIVREAGAGAMARVYEARDITTGTTVALKILRDGGEHTMRRFAREVAALGELTHPGIVRYISHGRMASGEGFLAMEWLTGESLEQRLERGPLGVGDAMTIGRGIAAALGAAHARSIVHRDVKPANIFLVAGDPAQPKLLDFGLVRDLDATYALTNTGDLLGTPLFMAPEQASCDLNLDARVDVYALGAVLYACLTGRPPITAGNIVGLLAKIVLEEPPPPSSLSPELPVILDELLARLLAKARDARPADGSQAASAIEAAAAGLASSPRRGPTTLPAREQRVVSILLSSAAAVRSVSLDGTFGSFGGALELADGSTMMVFDGPETPGDLATRAARFALGIAGSGSGVSIATGRAVLSGPTPMGEVIDRAAAQLSVARKNIRLDEDTAGLLEGRFEVARDADGAILVGEAAGAFDAVRTLLGKPTRCVGRDRELAAIEGYFAEAVSDATARAVVVIADAGVGKSRVAHEVVRRIAARSEAPEILVTRCESITERSPFAAAASLVRRAASIEPGERTVAQVAKLAVNLVRDGVTDPLVGEFLGEMLGIPTTPSERVQAARENPTLMFERIRAAWTGWLQSLTAVRPVLFVIEDLHWADASTVLLVDAALTALAEAPFMVLALARPEVKDRRIWAAHRPQELRLDPLSRRASERLVRDALGDGVTDATVADIIGRAQGHPLFLEELVRATRYDDGGELPVGIVGTVQRRFDALDPSARAVLRAASIFGMGFTAAGIVPLVAADLSVPAALDDLVSAELVERQRDGFAFRHALVRDAAYALLTAADRTLGHGLVAKWLAAEATPHLAVVAWHFERGGQTDLAARWYARAAEHALVHNDLEGALRHVEHALRWTEDHDAVGALDLIQAEAELWRGRLDQARGAAERATTRVERASAHWFEAAGMIITASGQVGANDVVEQWLARAMEIDPEPAAASACVLCLARGCSQLAWNRSEIAKRALAKAEAVATDEISVAARARLEVSRAYVHAQDGKLDRCVDGLHGVAARYTRLGAQRDALQTTLIALIVSNQGGHSDTAYPAMLKCAEQADELGARYLADWARWASATALFVLGERERAEATMSSAAALIAGQPLFQDVTSLFRAWAAFACDDLAGLTAIVDAVRPSYARFEAAFAGFAAYVELSRGDAARACDLARSALAKLASAPGVYADGGLAGYAPALATLVRAGAPDAAAAVAEHVARVEGLAAALGTPGAREAFLTRVPWNASVVALSAHVR
jgi:hypothetical protein